MRKAAAGLSSERYVNRLLSAAPAPTGAATVDDLEGHGVVRGLAHRGGEERRVREVRKAPAALSSETYSGADE